MKCYYPQRIQFQWKTESGTKLEKPRSKLSKQNQTAGFFYEHRSKCDRETFVQLLNKGRLGVTYYAKAQST